MNKYDGNQLLENMLATNTENNSVISFLAEICQTSKNQQSGETDGEKESADGNAEKLYAN